MRPQSIVVLGGTGFLGTRLVARLIKDGHRVIEAQLYQESVAELLIKIVRAPGYSKADEEAILDEFRDFLDDITPDDFAP